MQDERPGYPYTTVCIYTCLDIHHCKFEQVSTGSRCRGVRGYEVRCIAPSNFLTKILTSPKFQ